MRTDRTLDDFATWLRNARGVQEPCPECNGTGVRSYASTSTWRGGIGGQTFTSDVCDHCWGSGDEHRHGLDLRELTAQRAKHRGFAHRNHPNTTKRRGVDDDVDDRETPRDLFDELDREFGFTLDAAAARHNSKCRRYFARAPWTELVRRQARLWPEEWIGDPDAIGYDGLAQEWRAPEVVWCNPPFSDLYPWVKKAHEARCTVVMLLPANRTEQPWWQEFIEPRRDGRAPGGPETHFLSGRRAFAHRGETIGNSTSKNPPFGIVIVVWRRA